MNLLKSERTVFIAIILVLLTVIAVIGFKVYDTNEVMLIPRDKVENVKTCLNNDVSCSLLYNDKEEIPEEMGM